ncbi:hypothetical protein N7541_000580 [Penicillium brevicompactum]|uniref:Uncharacterized protein n=1 Tax=Penicillium brevicompactum TaxID=5074 RepID=A0A9W9V3U1_PENBR|nr:hypothetical protein N7541_000580 [Penicillium brevicompactum]
MSTLVLGPGPGPPPPPPPPPPPGDKGKPPSDKVAVPLNKRQRRRNTGRKTGDEKFIKTAWIYPSDDLLGNLAPRSRAQFRAISRAYRRNGPSQELEDLAMLEEQRRLFMPSQQSFRFLEGTEFAEYDTELAEVNEMALWPYYSGCPTDEWTDEYIGKCEITCSVTSSSLSLFGLDFMGRQR